MNPVTTIWNWLVWSSANPTQVSLTVRGVLVGLIPTLMAVAGIAHIGIGQDQLTAIFDLVAQLVQTVLSIVALAMTAYGFLRKLWITIRTHQEVTTSAE